MTVARGAQCRAEAQVSAAVAAFTTAGVPAPKGVDAHEAWRSAADRRAASRWWTHMFKGEFEAAWRESDAIRARGGFDPHRFWDGTRLDGSRVIVRCLHGMGDAIQFLRYVPELQSVAKNVVVEVAPRLLELVRCISGTGEVVSWGECAPEKPAVWDKQIEVMELPYYFRTKLTELPVRKNYIRVPDQVRLRAARTMNGSRMARVGVVWAGGDWNRSRSLPFAQLTCLLAIEGCEFWNLQGGAEHDQWNTFGGGHEFRDIAECGDGVLMLAAVIAEMELVITVDTLAAHLAGAMGKTAWVLLQHTADWRWMTVRSDSPWYPSLRLFRQPKQNDWEGLIAVLRDELRNFLDSWKTC